MKIIVFSDSHGRADAMQEVLRLHSDAEIILHAGDGAREFDYITQENPGISFTGVPGNCDFFAARNPASVTLDLDGIRILLTHGHRFSAKGGYDAITAYSRENNIDIAVFGHTHIPLDRYLPGEDDQKPLRLFNPGSISCPQNGKPTYGIIELSPSGILTSVAEYRKGLI